MKKVYIGWDSREGEAYRVAEASITARTNARDLEINPLKIDKLKHIVNRPIEWRGNQMWCLLSDAPQSTEFAITRFTLPFLTSGWALFVDCDILCLGDIEDLFKLADDRYAVMVVKHEQQVKADEIKMVDQASVYYKRKNWSSVMLVNCSHEAHRRLRLSYLNTWPGRDLHAFKWLEDHEIGELPVIWNHLVDVTETNRMSEAKLLHYTLGGPWIEGWQARESDKPWNDFYAQLPKIIIVPREQITFRRPNMRTEAGQEGMKVGEYYKRIKRSIQEQGLLNPLVCTQEGDKYVICLGNKRYIIGCELGFTHFPVIVTSTDLKADLLKIRATYKPASSDYNKINNDDEKQIDTSATTTVGS